MGTTILFPSLALTASPSLSQSGPLEVQLDGLGALSSLISWSPVFKRFWCISSQNEHIVWTILWTTRLLQLNLPPYWLKSTPQGFTWNSCSKVYVV